MKTEVVFYEKQFNLTTYINEDGIFIRIFPFLKHKFYGWDIISKVFIRKYQPIREYGGWGIKRRKLRINLFKRKAFGFKHILSNDIAFTKWGNMGLQLELTDGRRILIGTHKPVEMEEILRKLGKWKV